MPRTETEQRVTRSPAKRTHRTNGNAIGQAMPLLHKCHNYSKSPNDVGRCRRSDAILKATATAAILTDAHQALCRRAPWSVTLALEAPGGGDALASCYNEGFLDAGVSAVGPSGLQKLQY